jgi:hypothetical protein
LFAFGTICKPPALITALADPVTIFFISSFASASHFLPFLC